MAQLRLQKYIADQGVASRRKAEELIKQGKVFVNGEKAVIGQKVDSEVDQVTMHGRRLQQRETDKIVYIFNKPKGVTSTTRRFIKEKNVLDFFPKTHRLFPAGRLDKESTGMMILTNDGDLANRIMHPSNKSEKEYIVDLYQPLDDLSLKRMRSGITYEKEKYRTISTRILAPKRLRVILGEGKKRHIRMMLRACKYDVRELFRKRINKLSIGDLKPGKFRKLNSEDIAKLLDNTNVTKK